MNVKPSLSLKSMAISPFAPSKGALEGYLSSVTRALETLPEIYTPCILENRAPIEAFLQNHGFKVVVDPTGLTVSKI